MSSDLCILTWWWFNIQAQKELLDAELDLYKKSQSGEDTAMLKLQYTQLQIEVMFSYTYSTLQMTRSHVSTTETLEIWALTSCALVFVFEHRQLKGESWHQDADGVSFHVGVALSEEGGPEGEGEVCQFMQS